MKSAIERIFDVRTPAVLLGAAILGGAIGDWISGNSGVWPGAGVGISLGMLLRLMDRD